MYILNPYPPQVDPRSAYIYFESTRYDSDGGAWVAAHVRNSF